MPIGFNVCQDEDLLCWYCYKTYENKRELEIHSFIHSACGEEIIPIFNLIKVKKDSIDINVHGKTEMYSTTKQADTISDAVNELKTDVEYVKSIDSGYNSSDSANEVELLSYTVQDKNVKNSNSRFDVSASVYELNLLKNNVEHRNVKSYSVMKAMDGLNLLKNVEVKNTNRCESGYTLSDTVKELNSLKNNIGYENIKRDHVFSLSCTAKDVNLLKNVEDKNVKMYDSGYSSPSPPFPEKNIKIMNQI